MNDNWAKNCRTNWPIIDTNAFLSKNEFNGLCLLSFDDAFVKFKVIKIGKVTNKSS